MQEKFIVTKVSKWGNGYGVRIPKGVLDKNQLHDGCEVYIEPSKEGVLITRKTTSVADLSLSEILKGVTPDTIRADSAEDAFGRPVGNEVW